MTMLPDAHRMRVQAASQPAGYDVVIRAGALDALPHLLREVAPAARYAVISDASVAALHGAALLRRLHEAGTDAELLTFPAGEENKTRETWATLSDRMFEHGFGRDCCVVAFGGGVTGDMAGFVAASYMRGVPVVQVPTSLLAMIDAALGGKTGVDVPAGKNLVGAFHHPRLVLADPTVLRTLPGHELRSGLAEAVKHGAILDADYLAWLDRELPALLATEPLATERLVARSVELKTRVVTEDPEERGLRAVLNFGHTVGHALELRSRFELAHGHAVAIGMVVEARAGEIAGITQYGTADRLAQVLQRCGLPVALPDFGVDETMDAMRLDKKARQADPRLVLLQRIGVCAPDATTGGWTHALPGDTLRAALRTVIRDAGAV